MLAAPVAALALAIGAPSPSAAREANRLIERALAHELAALNRPASSEKTLFLADSALLDAKAILQIFRYGNGPNPLYDVGLAVVADHVALASEGAKRRIWTQKTIARTRAALRHLRPYR
jgi:hypothetical protein